MARDRADPILRLLLAVVIADGDIDPDELAAVQRHMDELRGTEVSLADLRALAEQLMAEKTSVKQCLHGLPALDSKMAQRVFQAAFEVASADGFVLEEEDSVLAQVAAALRMSEAQYRGTISALLDPRATSA